MRIVLSLALLFVALFSSATATPPVKAEVNVPERNVVAGAKFKATVKLILPEGYHAYQNPASQDYMIPVKVTITSKDFKLVSVVYPKGVAKRFKGDTEDTMVYEGTVSMPVEIQAPAKAGSMDLRFKVSFQICTDSDCLPPEDLNLSVKMKIKEQKAPVKK